MSIAGSRRTWRERQALCPPGFTMPCRCSPPVKGGVIACETFRVEEPNAGYSAGLQYRFVYGPHRGAWRVWDRHTGEIAWTWFGSHPVIADTETRAVATRLNRIETTPEQDAAMAIAHNDVE